MPVSDRAARLLRIVTKLQSGQIVNATDLARDCGVSRRTIFRDIDNLRRAGLQISYDEKKLVYQLEASPFQLPADLTTDEILALVVLCQDLADAETGIPYLKPARTAAFKLASVLPREMRKAVGDVLDSHHLDIGAHANLEDSFPIYEQLHAALQARQPLEVEYHGFTDAEPVQTELHPYRFFFNQRSWYVIGYSVLHRQIRTFHVKRFSRVRILFDQNYEIPPRFSLEQYFGNAWRMIREKDNPHHVVIRFAPLVAGNVAEVQWHKTQRLEWQEDGSLHFHVDVEGLNEISWWILGYGDRACVLEPEELRQRIISHARGMLEQYESS